ncbi:hypothetical protein [Amycolatopsis benzoatilytica]|uniref:hypothetical protein n=1 Tax=Amycolatopsis benzoatilytica TaxID=346045 RepID=UPI0003606CCA|nr:hypothetical protein [Amycolatopsis benzoatilytica]
MTEDRQVFAGGLNTVVRVGDASRVPAFIRAAAGHEGFAKHLAAGHDRLYLRDIAYLEANQYSLS